VAEMDCFETAGTGIFTLRFCRTHAAFNDKVHAHETNENPDCPFAIPGKTNQCSDHRNRVHRQGPGLSGECHARHETSCPGRHSGGESNRMRKMAWPGL